MASGGDPMAVDVYRWRVVVGRVEDIRQDG